MKTIQTATNISDYKQAIEKENEKHNLEIKRIKIQYAKANSSVLIDQIIEDNIGKIKVEKIRFALINKPQCIYFGHELDKKGNPKKRKGFLVYRSVWQSDLKKS